MPADDCGFTVFTAFTTTDSECAVVVVPSCFMHAGRDLVLLSLCRRAGQLTLAFVGSYTVGRLSVLNPGGLSTPESLRL